MIPAPNFFAGILIGIANDVWWAIPAASFVWAIVLCFYVSLKQSTTSYVVEFLTAFATSFLFGMMAFGIKSIFT